MRYHFKHYKFLLLMFDTLILYISLIVPYYIRVRTFPQIVEYPILFFYIITCLLLFIIFDLYNPWSHFSPLPIYYKSLIAFPIIGIVYLFFGFLNWEKNIIFESKLIFLINIILFTPLFFIARFYFYHWLKPEKLNVRILVIGGSSIVESFQREIEYRGGKWKVYYLLDNLKDIPEQNKDQIIGTIEENFFRVLENEWTAIILATKNLDRDKIRTLFKYKEKGVLVYDLIQFYEYYFFKIPLYSIDDYWFLSTKGFMIIEKPSIIKIKRILEVLITLSLLFFIIPILPILLVLVYLSDGFPLIFKQERLGKDNKSFVVYKFRTMKKGSEKLDPYTRENDNRVTKIGKFLRLTRLDEIPQIINILKGDMSLIGPRAEWIQLTEIYQKEIPFYYYRHLIRPGLTGWAQVMYPYGASLEDTIQKLEYDLYYIKNYSLLLDFSIIIKTVRIMLFGRGR
ncbi:MAG: exopolysaccharide biosynthesis polyprenyl glycosylphosphotransferase [Leptonema sp. (in: bacteria)]